jgi:hypothetical protein
VVAGDLQVPLDFVAGEKWIGRSGCACTPAFGRVEPTLAAFGVEDGAPWMGTVDGQFCF